MKGWRTSRRLRGAIGLLLALFVLAGSVFFALPWLLIATPQAPPSDVILHSAISSETDADEYVVQLYRQHIGKKIVCIALDTQCQTYTNYTRQHLLELGVPADDILTLPLPSTACLAPSMPRFIELMKAHHWQQAVLVVPPQVSRTDGSLVRKYFHRAGLNLAVTYAPGERARFTPLWWTNYQTAQAIIGATLIGVLDQIYSECQ